MGRRASGPRRASRGQDRYAVGATSTRFAFRAALRFNGSARRVRALSDMDITLQRAIDRYAGVPLCALFSLVDRLRPPAPPAALPRRILVILLSEMGSLVLAHAMFARLKRKYPAASI